MFRIGMGFDVHRLVEGRELWLGGVKIPWEKGLLGHSDADVAIHALCDALLGAAALRDIGYHFPDTDPRYKGIDSRLLLRHVMRLIDEKGYSLGNCDITICAEQPKINPHIPAMQRELAACMNCDTLPSAGHIVIEKIIEHTDIIREKDCPVKPDNDIFASQAGQ